MAIPFLAHLHDPSSEQRQQQQDAAALLAFDPNPHSANEQQSHHRHFHHHHHHHHQQKLLDQVLGGAMEMEDVESAGGEAPSVSPCEGASATAAAAAAAAPAPAAASRDTFAAPPWLASFLAAPYFVPCSLHAALHKSERNFFCIDCYTSATHGSDSSISSSSFNGSHSGSSSPLSSLCSVCVARAHHGHAVLQVRKSSYHDAVRVADIGRLIDVTAIQVYVINGAKIVFLNPRPQARPLKGAPYHCARCQRNLLDAGGHFCSVACKLEVVLLCSSSSNGGSGSSGSVSSGGNRTGIGDGARTPRQLLQLKARLLPPQMPLLPGLQQQTSKVAAAAAPSSPKKIVIKKLKAPPGAAAAAAAAASAPLRAAAEKGKGEVRFHGLDHASTAGVHSNSRCEVEEDDEDDLETVWLKQEAGEALAKNIVEPQPPLHPKLLLKRKFQQQMQMQQQHEKQMQQQQQMQQMQQGDDVTRKQHEVDQQQQQQQHEQQMKNLPKLQLPPLLIESKDESSLDFSGVEADRCGDGGEEETSQAKKRVRRMKEVYMHNGERGGGQTDTFPSLISHADEGPMAASNRPVQTTSIDTAHHLFNSPTSPHAGATEGGFTPGPPSPTFSSTSSPWSWRSPRHRRKGMPLRAHLV